MSSTSPGRTSSNRSPGIQRFPSAEMTSVATTLVQSSRSHQPMTSICANVSSNWRATPRAIDRCRRVPRFSPSVIPDPITDRNRRAVKELVRLARSLGLEGEALVRDVLGQRLSIEQAAGRRGQLTEPGIKYLGKRFRECLETLAKEF